MSVFCPMANGRCPSAPSSLAQNRDAETKSWQSGLLFSGFWRYGRGPVAMLTRGSEWRRMRTDDAINHSIHGCIAGRDR